MTMIVTIIMTMKMNKIIIEFYSNKYSKILYIKKNF